MPEEFVESVRHLSRTREQLRQDLMRCRHRVSKLLLQHGRVYPEPTTWNQRHRSWLQRQQSEHEPTEIALCDLLAGVDGTVARKALQCRHRRRRARALGLPLGGSLRAMS